MAEKRKVQKTGGSTFIVSLPKDWAKTRLKEGDYVYIDKGENSLRVHLEQEEEGKKVTKLEYQEPLETLLRKIIANYLVGYDEIKIEASKVIGEKEKIKDLVRKNIMGVEITGESSKEIELQNLLKYSDLPTSKVIERIDSIVKGMYEDVATAFQNDKKEVLKDVIKRENEIDRLYLLGVRQIKASIRSERIRKKLNIRSKLFCLGYRLILKSLERIGDHLKKISRKLLKLKEIPMKEQLSELGERSLSSYNKGMNSLFKLDKGFAEKSISSSKEADEVSKNLSREEFSDGIPFQVKTMIRSMDRTRKLTRDISEIVLNLIAGESI